MSLDTILKRLPSHYDKNPSSNNYKALSLVAKHIDDSEELYATIQKFWDVDQAVGKGLDRLGKDEGISRGSYDDDTYRKLIKIEFIVNMSEGDAEVMNTILEAYMGDDFLYIEEGWSSVLEEPAAMIINLSESATSFQWDLMARIKPAGVGIYLMVNSLNEYMAMSGRAYTFPFLYRITGKFRPVPVEGMGSLNEQLVNSSDPYEFPYNYKTTGKFGPIPAEGAVGDLVESVQSFIPYTFQPHYKITGRFRAGEVY